MNWWSGRIVALVQGLAIEYAAHFLFIPIGYALLRLSRTDNPHVKALPARSSLRLFLLLSGVFIAIELSSSFPGQSGTSITEAFGGPYLLTAALAFEGIVVGWTEEYLFRGCLQRMLNRRFKSMVASRIRSGTLIAAILFGLFHFVNIILGQSFNASIPHVIFATFFGMVVGWYYDRTSDFAGVAWIHNITDLAGTVLPLLL